jgi:hypothetical protein
MILKNFENFEILEIFFYIFNCLQFSKIYGNFEIFENSFLF